MNLDICHKRNLILPLLLSGLLLMAITEIKAQQKGQPAINYAEQVNAKLGTKGKGYGVEQRYLEAGYTYPGATFPFGMVQFTTTFFNEQKGFVINQMSGAGCNNMGNLPTLPLKGDLRNSPEDMKGFEPDYNIKTANAGYYQADLFDDIMAELTVTKRTGFAQFTYPENQQKGTVLVGTGINATELENASVKITGRNSFEGKADGGSFCGSNSNYTVHFAGTFDTEFSDMGAWEKSELHKGVREANGSNSGLYFTFDVSEQKKIKYKIGISYVSIENAKANLETENSGWNFENVRNETQQTWNSYLGKIKVSGGSEVRTKQFYSNLYHVLIHPSTFTDVNGEYRGSDHKVYKAEGFEYYTAFSNWDTYRSQVQLISLLAPEKTEDIVTSHIKFARRSGGGFPRWVLADYATGIMQGDPSSILVANAYAFGATGFDTKAALEIMRRGAEQPGTKSQDVLTRTFLDQYLEKGYIWDHMGASITLEFTSADFAIGQFALQAEDNQQVYKHYLKRAQNWKQLYNPGTNWLQSRKQDGSWKEQTADWREASYKNYFWMVPYNLSTLIDTIGGKRIAEKRLDDFFRRLDANYHQEWFAAGNEPDFQVPWIYNWIDKPYKTQLIVRRTLRERFSNDASGLPGNEDLGAMGAWYVFANMGMYPMIPGYGGFSLNSPLFPEIRINLGSGNTLTIKGGSEDTPYISGLKVNEEAWDSTWLPFNKIKNGGEIIFELSDNPHQEWGIEKEPPSFDTN